VGYLGTAFVFKLGQNNEVCVMEQSHSKQG